MINKDKLGGEIRQARTKLGWSQRYLAQKAEVTVGCISLVENGRRGIGMSLLERLAKAFQVPASFLLVLAEEPHKGDIALDAVKASVRAIMLYTAE